MVLDLQSIKTTKTLIKVSFNLRLLNDRFHTLVKKHLKRIKKILENESHLSSKMFRTYFRYSKGVATREEMSEANRQFKSLMKSMGLSFLIILPLAPITIPAIIALGKKYGIDMIPDSFKEEAAETSKPS